MNELEKVYGSLTEDEKELLFYFFRMDRLTQMRFLGKVEAASEIYARLAKMFSSEAKA